MCQMINLRGLKFGQFGRIRIPLTLSMMAVRSRSHSSYFFYYGFYVLTEFEPHRAPGSEIPGKDERSIICFLFKM